jgi:hypothetical protein
MVSNSVTTRTIQVDSETLEKAERAANVSGMPTSIYIRHLIESDLKKTIGGAGEQLTTQEGMEYTKRTKSVWQYKSWCKKHGIRRIGMNLWPTHKLKIAMRKEARGIQL